MSISAASFSTCSGKNKGKSNSESIDCISTSLSPGFPSTLRIFPKGLFALSGHSVISANTLSPFFAEETLSIGIKISTGIKEESGITKAYLLCICKIPTNEVFALSIISIICPSRFLFLRCGKR